MFRDPYFRPLLCAFGWQFAFLFIFRVMVLDLGQRLQACCAASAAFWLGAILVLVRRPRNPTRGDLAYLKWGLVPIVLVSNPVFIWVWTLKGAL
jgi:hypothetical protein